MRLRNRLLVTMLGMWSITLVILGVAMDELLSRRLLAHVAIELADQGRLMHALIGEYLRERERDLEGLSTDEHVLLDLVHRKTTYAELIHARNMGGSFQKLRVVAPDGTVVVDTDQLGNGMPQQGWEHFSPEIIQIMHDGLGTSLAQLEYPLPNGGWIVGVIPLRRITEVLPLQTTQGNDLRIRLIDPKGNAIYDSQDRATLDQRSGKAGVHDRLESNITEPIFYGGDAWTIQLSVDRDVILHPLNLIRWLVLALIPISLLVGGLLIWRLSNSLSRPLHPMALT